MLTQSNCDKMFMFIVFFYCFGAFLRLSPLRIDKGSWGGALFIYNLQVKSKLWELW